MNKELEALERIIDTLLEENKNKIEVSKANGYDCELLEERRKDLESYKQALIKAQEQDVLLKIIENKLFSIIYFVDEIRPEIHKTDYSDYKYWYTRKRYGKPDEMYTEDEFNKIMNWLYKKRGKNNES